MLNPQFANLAELAPENLAAVRGTKRNALLFEKQYHGVDTGLLFRAQSVPPCFEFIGEEHVEHV